MHTARSCIFKVLLISSYYFCFRLSEDDIKLDLRIDKRIFLEKLDDKSGPKGPTLRQYVLVNLEFLVNCRHDGYTLTALAEVISEDLGRKVYSSNLGRLLKKYEDTSKSEEVRPHQETTQKAVIPTPTEAYEDLFKASSIPDKGSKDKHKNDPLGIGGLM